MGKKVQAKTKGPKGWGVDGTASAAGTLSNADSLGDLSSAFGDDYGHGTAGSADPNVLPVVAGPPVVSDIENGTATITWKAVAQAATKITIQAEPVNKKSKKDSSKAFKKFVVKKGKGVQGIVNTNADTATSTILTGLDMGVEYFFRITVTNPKGTTCGSTTDIILAKAGEGSHTSTPSTDKKKKDKKEDKKSKDKKEDKKGKEQAKATSSNAGATATTSSDGGIAGAPLGKKLSKKVASRLGGASLTNIDVKKDDGDKPKLFAAPKEQEERSKIWKALNPEKLFYESRREKVEQEEEAIRITIRGGGIRDYARAKDDLGNLIEEEDSEYEEEEEDLENLPDFGEFEGEMAKLRAKRAEELKAKQDKLRQEWERKKAAEQAILDKELTEIAKRQKKEEAKQLITDKEVKAIQKKLEKELEFGFKFEAS